MRMYHVATLNVVVENGSAYVTNTARTHGRDANRDEEEVVEHAET